MPNLIIRQVTLSWSSGRRRHHSGGVMDIYPQQVSTVTAGDHFSLPPPASTAAWDIAGMTHQAAFAFMTIGGDASGAKFYTAADLTAANPVPIVTVDATDINVVSFYLETGGGIGPPPPPALYIDAFNATTGQFMDDDFVNIVINGTVNTPLSVSANNDGIVATNAAQEHVLAFTGIGSAHFQQWQSLAGTEPVAANDLTVMAGSTAFYLALYESPIGQVIIPIRHYEIWQWVDAGTKVDGGPHPWNPMIAALALGITIADEGHRLGSPKLKKQMIELGAKQVTMAAEKIAEVLLKGRG